MWKMGERPVLSPVGCWWIQGKLKLELWISSYFSLHWARYFSMSFLTFNSISVALFLRCQTDSVEWHVKSWGLFWLFVTFNCDSHKYSSLFIDYLLDYNTGEEKSSKNLLGSATSEYDLVEKCCAEISELFDIGMTLPYATVMTSWFSYWSDLLWFLFNCVGVNSSNLKMDYHKIL